MKYWKIFVKKYQHLSKKRRYILLGVVIFLLFENFILAYNNLQNRVPILGLKLNDQPLSFLPREEVEQTTIKQVQENNKPLRFIYQDKIFEVKPAEVGAKVDPKQLTNKLIERGRKRTVLQK